MLTILSCEKIIGAAAIRHMTLDERAAVAPRFWAKTAEGPDGCLLWTGAVGADGYGKFAVADGISGAHRVAYELAQGPIPEGFIVRHRCPKDHNTLCVRHLELGTHAENAADMVAAGRSLSGRPNPRKLSPKDCVAIIGARGLGIPRTETARDYGVGLVTVHNVLSGRAHAAAVDAHIDAELAKPSRKPRVIRAALDRDALDPAA